MSRSSDSPLTPEEHAARPEAAESPRARADRAVAAEEALSSARQAEELPAAPPASARSAGCGSSGGS